MYNKMKRTLTTAIVLFALLFGQMQANEGKWIPMLLEQNFADMQRLGLRLTAEQIYSVNQSSLKHAIVSFGGFCTGSLISADGLVLTNHHCGRGQIHAHSTLENNLMENGFWAMSRSEELPNPGLFVRFLIRAEDVTDEVLATLNNAMTEPEREAQIRRISREIEERATAGTHYDARVVAFFEGNEFFLQVHETFRDIRLVWRTAKFNRHVWWKHRQLDVAKARWRFCVVQNLHRTRWKSCFIFGRKYPDAFTKLLADLVRWYSRRRLCDDSRFSRSYQSFCDILVGQKFA